jgi:hypothetical protein
MTILKIVILVVSKTISKFKALDEADFQQSAKLRTSAVFEQL